MKDKQLFEIPHEGSELTRAARRKIDDGISELERRVQFLETKRHELDDIGELERGIQSLKTKRNELSSTSVLPLEVLSKIFIFARNSSIDGHFCNRHAQWIRVGHVCHHWRGVALGCASLWSIPVFTRPCLAQEMIQRSKMAALTIRSIASTWTPRMLEQLENALAQISRIQSIELTLRNYTKKLKTIYSLLSQPAPLLKNISLSGPAYANQFSLPLDALYDAPSLRSIEFHSLNFSWKSAIFKHRNLTVLRLKNNYGVTNGTSTVGQMMDALHHLPNLRILELHDSIPSHTTSNGNEKTVEFKFLEQFELITKAVDCIFLLRHIQYPPNATTTLRSSSTDIEDSMTIISLLGQHLHRTQSIEVGTPYSPVVVRSARLSSPESDAVEITFSSTSGTMNGLPVPGSLESLDPIIRIHLVGDCAQAHTRLFTSLCNCFDLSSLRSLLLDWSFPDNHIRTIRDSFEKLPDLEIINVSQSLPEICLTITGSLGDERPKNNHLQKGASWHSFPPITVFPALRTFIVQCADFRPSRRAENMEHLTDMLVKRSNIDAPIDRLSLERCRGVRTWQKRWLGELVVNLEVRGEVIDVGELDSGDDLCSDDDYSDDSDEDEDENDESGSGEVENEYSDDDCFYLGLGPWLGGF